MGKNMYFAVTMKTPVSFLLLIVCTTAFAQPAMLEKELDDIYLSNNIYEVLTTNNNFYSPYRQSAKNSLENYIAKYPENPYKFVAMRYLGQIFEKLNLVDSSVLLYKQLLTMPEDIDHYNWNRFTSAFQLTKIYLAKKDYNTALNYLEQASGQFFEKSSCGTVKLEDRQRINALYWDCYFGLGDYKQAIDRFARFMFSSVWGNEQKLYDAYVKVYSKEEMKKEFLEAEHNIEIKSKQYGSHCHFNPVVKIFDKEMILYIGDEFEKLTEQERMQQCIEELRKSKMYKLATQSL
jgi:tetratricopeptide (TPR) repeat protein